MQIAFDNKLRPPLKKVPERTNKLANDQIIRILLHYPEQKHAILPQVLKHETLHRRRIRTKRRRDCQAVVHLQISLNKTHTRTTCKIEEPHEKAVSANHENHGHPKPQKYKNLLIEQIDRQRALDRVAVVVLAQCPNHEIAHGNTRKPRRLPEIFPQPNISDHMEAVQVEARSHKRVQQKKLTENIGQIDNFDEHIQCCNV